MNDELIDAIANTCWYYQGQHLKEGKELPCICNALKDMVFLTIENMEKIRDTKHLAEQKVSFSSITITNETP